MIDSSHRGDLLQHHPTKSVHESHNSNLKSEFGGKSALAILKIDTGSRVLQNGSALRGVDARTGNVSSLNLNKQQSSEIS